VSDLVIVPSTIELWKECRLAAFCAKSSASE